MTLENEIKQTRPFSSKKEKTLVNLFFTNNWFQGKQHRLLKSHGISIQQYNVMRILKGQAGLPVTINDIIERMLDKTSNASRLVDKLELKEFVIRKLKPNNKRAVDVLITDLGIKTLEKINVEMGKLISDIIDLEDNDLDTLNLLLDKLRSDFE
jgi:DNA-binding MarR family transcriptional regulator